ncbi:MAG TPA: DUF308 domain-containing protein [Gaiellaceae bacterium]|jgi:uncharacterized membrane protein HdeD (DUF308 family)|nr:DUF308 domain-containing protein [Gaiellaceae bacterium]
MLLNPLSNRTTFEIDEAEQVASSWWVFLLAGVISIVFGALILAIDWTVNGLAAFVGTLFIIQGAAYLITKPLDGGTRSTNVIAGLLGIAAGIALLVWPDRGLYVLAVFIGAWIIVSGVMHIVGALANRQAPHWWLVLILGVIETPLGIWAIRRPGITLAILITLIGAWAIVMGIWEIVIALEVRKLAQRLRGVRPIPAS